MRITGNTDMGPVVMNKSVSSAPSQLIGSTKKAEISNGEQVQHVESDAKMKAKVQEVVGKFNKMLEADNSTAKILFHEGLNRYYVSVVDRETDEVVKEIPPKKLLDAFYEMQKVFGVIVDEKI